jgi:hypothetical protein
MSDQDKNVDEALEGLDAAKRETLSRLVTGAAFVVPVVASFTMRGLAIRPAHAAVSFGGSNTTVPNF